VIGVCEVCGENFEIDKQPKKFCSRKCLSKAMNARAREKRLMGFNEEKVKWLVKQVNSFNLESTSQFTLDGFTERVREEIRQRDNYTCQICGRVTDLQVHHIIPRSNGGKHTLDNLITLCFPCHRHIDSGNERNALRKCFSNYKRYSLSTEGCL
jgi:predicted restriction endonuclease